MRWARFVKLWVSRLLDSGLHQRISSRLLSGSKEEPLSESELQHFLDDLRAFLHVDADDTWSSLLSVLDGQPFRLNLWHCLALLCGDSDSDYFHVLREWVPLGVGSVIPQCRVMHPPAPPDSVRLPLQHCESAWKSAIDHADFVDTLLASEVDAGWICEVPRRYKYTAVGKSSSVLCWPPAAHLDWWLTPPTFRIALLIRPSWTCAAPAFRLSRAAGGSGLGCR